MGISTIIDPNEGLAKSATLARQDREKMSLLFPFLEYSVRNVLFHADTSGSHGISQDGFLSYFETPEWIALHNIFEQYEVRRYRPETRLSYIFAKVNTPYLIKDNTKTLSCIEEGKEPYGYPLLAAIAHKNNEAPEAFREVLIMALPPETCIRVQAEPGFQVPVPVKNPEFKFRFSSHRSIVSYFDEYGDGRLLTLTMQHQKCKTNITDEKGRTPSSWAVQSGHERIVNILLERNEVDPNSRDERGMTPLAHACKFGYQGILETFLNNKKVNLESRDNKNRTPLSWAFECGALVVMQLLLKTGKVDTNSQDNNGRTPLSWAAVNGRQEALAFLLKTGKVDIDSRDNNGRTSLSWAAINGNLNSLKLLLETGKIDPDSRDKNGRTPLSWASEYGTLEVMKVLLRNDKVDPDSPDIAGRTPLFWASPVAARQLLLDTGTERLTKI